ncbi:hypothetical protein OS493_018584 [Desmophyllum pertusum]|uniref:Uncharacterized protein n=1 Tax=Desmophyllum pertusum TaxID=174260 RepID=A0A9X0D2K6_9CNID|nr:hypothetical protein OS493_018584 [Desmophyllum pertusum]
MKNRLVFIMVLFAFSDDQSSSNLSDNKGSQGSDEDEDEMVTEALQFNQLSLEEFCIILLSRVVPMFQGSLCTDSAINELAVNLLHKVLSLMTNVFPVDLWRGGTKLNSLMGSVLVESALEPVYTGGLLASQGATGGTCHC